MYVVEEKNTYGIISISYHDDLRDCKRYIAHHIFVYLCQNQEIFSYGEQFTIGAYFSYLFDNDKANLIDSKAYDDYHNNTRKLFGYLALYEDANELKLESMKYEGYNDDFGDSIKINMNDKEYYVEYCDQDSTHFISTNINDKSAKEYYFISKQIVVCREVPSKYELDEEYNLSIKMYWVDDKTSIEY